MNKQITNKQKWEEVRSSFPPTEYCLVCSQKQTWRGRRRFPVDVPESRLKEPNGLHMMAAKRTGILHIRMMCSCSDQCSLANHVNQIIIWTVRDIEWHPEGFAALIGTNCVSMHELCHPTSSSIVYFIEGVQ